MYQFPNITWAIFDAYNDSITEAFETMCRRLFTAEFLKGQAVPHSNHNNKGIEVMPILEPPREDGQPQKRISFQAKYTTTPSSAYSKFKKSAEATAVEYKGKLDLVYLFCNKTLTTTTSGYKEIVKIHESAGIETYPISNQEVLDLVAKYRDIAEYFFKPRLVADVSANIGQNTIEGVSVDAVTGNIIISQKVFGQKPQNSELLKQLVAEKVETCRGYACSFELEALKSELENLISYGIDGVEGSGEIYYYQALVSIHDGKNSSDCLIKCDNHDEIEWLRGFFAEPVELNCDQFLHCSSTAQVFIIDKLFTSQYWRNVVELCDAVVTKTDPSISVQLDLHRGLSLLNLHENEKAKGILYDLYDRTNEKRFEFYAVLADIRNHCEPYQEGLNGSSNELEKLLIRLEGFKEIKQYKQQELIVAAVTMESCYYLGISDSDYLETAIERYGEYSEKLRANIVIKFYYGLCLEMNGDRNKATEIYASLTWQTDLGIAERYMLCLILNNKPEKALDVYEQLEETPIQLEAIRLFAMDRSGSEDYEEELTSAVEKYKNSIIDFTQIVYLTDSEKPTREIVVPVLKSLIEQNEHQKLSLHQRIQMLSFLAHCKEVELLEMMLDSIDDLSVVTDFAIGEIYRAIVTIANREYLKTNKLFQKPVDFISTEHIADRFIFENIKRERFLQVKMLCAGAKQENISYLKYTKELFEYTHDEGLARSIIAVLIERKNTNPNDYHEYLEALNGTDNPEYCTVISIANRILGREDDAEFYAYKAIYLLNGENDYPVFRNYFNIVRIHLYDNNIPIRTVGSKMIAVLQSTEGTESVTIALDPEMELSDESNHSFGIEHIHKTNPDYDKLIGTGINQIINFRGKQFKVIEIFTRGIYGFKYISSKVQEAPEQFHGVVWMVSTTDPKEFIEKVRELTDNSEHTKAILESYHFKNTKIGLPIDSLTSGDYSRYIDALKYLLLAQNEAFYAGENLYVDETGQKYVPTLSTLVLLSVLNRLDVLNEIKDDLIIPDSYDSFFREQYSKAMEVSRMTASTLFFHGEQAIMQEPDKTIPDVWEAIINYCNNIIKAQISDDERIDFKIVEGLTGERFITGFQLDQIHLDAFILARREQATYLCDDLFFRKIAAWMELRHLNITSLIQHYNADFMMPFIMDLSKTNYIYLPLRARNNDEANELLQNIMDGEKKRQYYGEYLRTVQEAKERVLRELFGDEVVDRALKEAEHSRP